MLSRPLVPRGPRGPIYSSEKGTLPIYVEQAVQNSKSSYEAVMDNLLNECEAAGWILNSPWDLVVSEESDECLFPILVSHLRKPYPDAELEGIVSALAHKSARKYALDEVRKLFRKSVEKMLVRTSNGCVNTLISMANPSDVEYFQAILTDPTYVDCYSALIPTYARLAKKNALPILRKLMCDEVEGVVVAAAKEVGKLRDVAARKKLEELASSKVYDVRQSAKRALKRLDEAQ